MDMHTIQLTNKRNPNVLFTGTASCDAEGCIKGITKELQKNLICLSVKQKASVYIL